MDLISNSQLHKVSQSTHNVSQRNNCTQREDLSTQRKIIFDIGFCN